MWIVRIGLNRPYTFIVAAVAIVLMTPVVLQRTPTIGRDFGASVALIGDSLDLRSRPELKTCRLAISRKFEELYRIRLRIIHRNRDAVRQRRFHIDRKIRIVPQGKYQLLYADPVELGPHDPMANLGHNGFLVGFFLSFRESFSTLERPYRRGGIFLPA
jgi:hypothetical protein